MNLLDLLVKVSCDDQASDKVGGISNKIKSGLGSAAKAGAAALVAATAAVAAGVASVSKLALDGYAQYEQLAGGVEKLFGDSASTVISKAKSAYETAGMSANQYMETVTSFSASLISSLGGDTVKAAEVADTAVRDMSDNANTFGTNIQDIQNAYQGFAKQNYTMLDNLKLGYGGTKTEMERLIADANKVKEANGEMADLSIESFADIVEAIHIMQEEMNIAGTTAREAAQTIEGSINSMKAAWQNWLVALGDENANLEQETGILVNSVVTVVNNVGPRVIQILQSLGNSISAYLPELLNILMGLIGQFAEVGIQVVLQLVNAILSALPSVLEAAAQIIATLITGIAEAIPTLIETMVNVTISMIQALIDSIPQVVEAALQLVTALVEGITNAIPIIVEAIPQIVDAMVNTLLSMINVIIDTGVKLLTSLIQNLPQIISSIVAVLPQIISSLTTFFMQSIPQIVQAGITLLTALIQNMPAIINTIVGALPEIISSIINSLSSMIPMLVECGVQLFVALIENLPTAISAIVGAMPGLVSSIVQALSGLIPLMINAGFQLLMGLAQGIANAVGNVIQSAINAVSGVVDSILGFLGIHSPSRLFAGIGDMSMQGLGVGFEEGADDASQTLEDTLDGMTRTAEVNVTGKVSPTNLPKQNERNFEFNVIINTDREASDYGRKIGESLFETMKRMELSY